MRVGEVIQASTAEFVAQAYELDGAPPFGSLVWVADGGPRIVGVVCHTETGPLDAGRRPVARGQSGLSREEIFREHPELTHLLHTSFSARVLGFVDGDEVWHRMPPRPAALHEPVLVCAPSEVERFTRDLTYLVTLVQPGPDVSPDELAAAALRQIAPAHRDRQGYLVAAGRELVRLLGADPSRLIAVLTRMAP